MTTIAPDSCECCHQPIGSIGHFTDDEYPPGAVLCRPCWRDRLVGVKFGATVECSRLAPESVDLVTGRVTTVDESGVTTTTRREPVGWCGPGDAPGWLRPALGPAHNDQEEHTDD